MTKGRPILEVNDVSLTFRQPGGEPIRAVRNVTFSVMPGETVALVGGSGSGKSTLARIVLCLARPDDGEVYLAGERIDRMPPRQLRGRRKGMQPVFQDSATAFNPRRTALQSLAQALRQAGVPPADITAAAARLLNQVNLRPVERFMSRFPHELSGGQRQRLSIARALAVDPRLIVADEPLSGADVSIRGQVLNLMLDLQQARGVSYLFITHDIAVARSFAHRVLVMHAGAIVEQGPAETVFNAPRHEFTQRLVRAANGAGDGAAHGADGEPVAAPA